MKDRIKSVRVALNLTQSEFAERLGLTRNGVTKYEIGANAPSLPVIKLICKEFGVNEDFMINGNEPMFIEKISNDSIVESLAKENNWNDLDKELALLYVNNPGIRDKLKALLDEYENSKKD